MKKHHQVITTLMLSLIIKELAGTFSTPKGSPLKRSKVMIKDLEIMQTFINNIATWGYVWLSAERFWDYIWRVSIIQNIPTSLQWDLWYPWGPLSSVRHPHKHKWLPANSQISCLLQTRQIRLILSNWRALCCRPIWQQSEYRLQSISNCLFGITSFLPSAFPCEHTVRFQHVYAELFP